MGGILVSDKNKVTLNAEERLAWESLGVSLASVFNFHVDLLGKENPNSDLATWPMAEAFSCFARGLTKWGEIKQAFNSDDMAKRGEVFITLTAMAGVMTQFGQQISLDILKVCAEEFGQHEQKRRRETNKGLH